MWDLSQPFYLKYTGNKLQVINKDGKLEFEKAAYGGQALEQKPESSGYKVHEVTIKNKVYYFHYDKDRQCNKESGVLPEGNYFVDIDGKSVYGFFYDMEKFFLSRIDIYRTSYLDDKNILIKDNVYRDNFYIHGGSTYLDNKGIELAKDFDTFFDELSKYNEQKQAFTINNRTPIRVQVEYEKDGWREPLDLMEINIYNSYNNFKPSSAVFGYTRLNTSGLHKVHQGVDLFAIPEITPVYASILCKVINAGYLPEGGNTVILEVDQSMVKFLKNKIEQSMYSLSYESDGEVKYGYTPKLPFGVIDNYNTKSRMFDNSSNFITFRYLHLHSICISIGQTLKPGDIIGYAGRTGSIAENTPAPHLHIEVLSEQWTQHIGGMHSRINPGYVFSYKTFPNDINLIDNETIYRQKNWRKILSESKK